MNWLHMLTPTLRIEALSSRLYWEQWKLHQEDVTLAEACTAVDELELGWDSEWQTLAITDMEAWVITFNPSVGIEGN
jgi:hypothetical protein